jgi:hypothetical protein
MTHPPALRGGAMWGTLPHLGSRSKGAGMFQRKALRHGMSVMVAAIGAAVIWKAYPAAAESLKAEGASASTNSRSQALAARLTLRNVSGKTLQAFIGTEPAANDDVGNAYTATSLSGPDVKGVSVCWSGSHCLTGDREKTERNATTIRPDGAVVLNIAFCCKVSGTALPSKASADVQIQVRESSHGKSFSPWQSVSVGWPEFAVTAGK